MRTDMTHWTHGRGPRPCRGLRTQWRFICQFIQMFWTHTTPRRTHWFLVFAFGRLSQPMIGIYVFLLARKQFPPSWFALASSLSARRRTHGTVSLGIAIIHGIIDSHDESIRIVYIHEMLSLNWARVDPPPYIHIHNTTQIYNIQAYKQKSHESQFIHGIEYLVYPVSPFDHHSTIKQMYFQWSQIHPNRDR